MDFSQQYSDDHAGSAPSETGIPGAPSPQFALLNYLFPGYSMLTSVANSYLGADVTSYMPVLVVLLAVSFAWNYIRDNVWSFFDDYFMSSVVVRNDDELYNMVMLWISRQKFAHESRHFVANTTITSQYQYMWDHDNSDDDDDDDDDDSLGEDADASVNVHTGQSNTQKQALHYTPSLGTHLFWYKLWPLTFQRVQTRDAILDKVVSDKEEIRISCFGRSSRLLKELLLEARQLYMKKDERKTVLYRANLSGVFWQRCTSRANRPFSTVILNEDVKQSLIADASDYLRPATRRWYANRGIPYRRGYLLHGPPGTGKSSLSLALAGHFRMKIYMVSLSSNAATEENLSNLFHELPTRCVVLFEDIDSAGLTHTRDESSTASESISTSSKERDCGSSSHDDKLNGRLSLSGLLNILDGVASQEGRILVMTTNYIEKLDRALIRPGRVDMAIPFGLADSAMSASMFRAIYMSFDGEEVAGPETKTSKSPADEARLIKNRAKLAERAIEQAEIFAKTLPELEFTPAEIQGFLLKHKFDPDGAVDSVTNWVMQLRKEKQETAKQEAEKRQKEEDEAKKSKQVEKDHEGPKQKCASSSCNENKEEDVKHGEGSKSEEQEEEQRGAGLMELLGSSAKVDITSKSASDSGHETS